MKIECFIVRGQRRFRIIAKNGYIADDANGYGYPTRSSANRRLNAKYKGKEKQFEHHLVKAALFEKYPTFADALSEYMAGIESVKSVLSAEIDESVERLLWLFCGKDADSINVEQLKPF